jgi:hypothetical protein
MKRDQDPGCCRTTFRLAMLVGVALLLPVRAMADTGPPIPTEYSRFDIVLFALIGALLLVLIRSFIRDQRRSRAAPPHSSDSFNDLLDKDTFGGMGVGFIDRGDDWLKELKQTKASTARSGAVASSVRENERGVVGKVTTGSGKLQEPLTVGADLADYYRRLDRHEWHFCFADAGMAHHKRGEAELRALEGFARTSVAHQALFDAFRAHHNSGPAWGSLEQPKPVLCVDKEEANEEDGPHEQEVSRPLQVRSELAPFYRRLERHDWFYNCSDAPGVSSLGEAEAKELDKLAETTPEHRKLLDAFCAYHYGVHTIREGKTVRLKQPKPILLAPPKKVHTSADANDEWPL